MQLDLETCLKRLQDGNTRFKSGRAENSAVSRERMAETAGKQQPFAAVIACSDSRSPVEMVFDQSWGDLFVIRVAGNVCSTEVLGSVEFALEYLEIPLLVVLGHMHCGAVQAAVSAEECPGNIGRLVELIKPAVDKARAQNPSATPKQLAAGSIEANVWLAVESLLTKSSPVSLKVRRRECLVVGAILDISTGDVRWLGEHPLQAALMMH